MVKALKPGWAFLSTICRSLHSAHTSIQVFTHLSPRPTHTESVQIEIEIYTHTYLIPLLSMVLNMGDLYTIYVITQSSVSIQCPGLGTPDPALSLCDYEVRNAFDISPTDCFTPLSFPMVHYIQFRAIYFTMDEDDLCYNEEYSNLTKLWPVGVLFEKEELGPEA